MIFFENIQKQLMKRGVCDTYLFGFEKAGDLLVKAATSYWDNRIIGYRITCEVEDSINCQCLIMILIVSLLCHWIKRWKLVVFKIV